MAGSAWSIERLTPMISSLIKIRCVNIIGLASGLILACTDAFSEVILSPASSREIVATMQPFPSKARGAVEALLDFADGTKPAFTPCSTQPLVDFVSAACVTDSGWKLFDRNGAAGAAYVVTVRTPLDRYLALNFHPGIPDYAVFPASLRYSACLNNNEMKRAYACIGTGPTGTQVYVTGRMTGVEEITPNPESGSYFSYTNSRTFVRCQVADRDVLFSCSDTLAPSTYSLRGVPVGPLDQALFYYSGKPGLNLSGMTWMLSQITRSTTLSVYVALNSNETAVATFAWLNAGWQGLNVTRASHILNSQRNTLDFSRRIAQHPAVSAPIIAAIVDTVNGMTPAAIHADYGKYLAYVGRIRRDQERKGLFSCNSLLHELYDPKASQAIPQTHMRALIIQERLRTILGIPTWSIDANGSLIQK
ncbi:MAG: hypothetical protein WCO42_04440 [bacterium]